MPKPTKKTSLLGGLLARFGARKEPPEATGPLRPFQAISIYRGLVCCDMARKFSINHRDRRAEPRRLIDFGVASRLFDGRERRARRGDRRSKD